jgi:hypothetical protein
MNKKTIFLLPLDLKGKKQTRITPKFIRDVFNTDKVEVLPEHLQKKKKNIFTVELNRLIGKISEKNKNPELKKESIAEEVVEKPVEQEIIKPELVKEEVPVVVNSNLPQIDESYTLLNKIYAGDNSLENADLYLQSIFQTYKIKSYSLFYFEPHTFTYYPIFSQGLSEKARTNLLFQRGDKFIQNKKEGFIHLYFQPVLLNDIFFKKKFSPQELTQFSSIVLKFLDTHTLPGLVTFFYDRDASPSQEEIEEICQKIDKDLEPLIPFLNSTFQKELDSKIDSFDFLRKIIHAINIQTNHFPDGFYFTKIKIANYLTVPEAISKKNTFLSLLKNYLLSKEGLIEISPYEFILITKENEVEKIMKFISENSKSEFEFKIKTRKYPDDGKNLYLYF